MNLLLIDRPRRYAALEGEWDTTLRPWAWQLLRPCSTTAGRKSVSWAAMVWRLAGIRCQERFTVDAFQSNRSAGPGLSALLVAAHRTGVEMRPAGMYHGPESSSVDLFDPDLPVAMA